MGTNDKMDTVLEQLEQSQELVEQYAVDAINQQDIVYSRIKEGEGWATQLIGNFEAIYDELEEVTTVLKDKYSEVIKEDDFFKLTGLCDLISLQKGNIDELGQGLQAVIDEEEQAQQNVHQMEEQIALHREVMDELYSIMK